MLSLLIYFILFCTWDTKIVQRHTLTCALSDQSPAELQETCSNKYLQVVFQHFKVYDDQGLKW